MAVPHRAARELGRVARQARGRLESEASSVKVELGSERVDDVLALTESVLLTFVRHVSARHLLSAQGIHDLLGLRRALEMVKEVSGPVLLHVFTRKGQGFDPACEDPVMFHAPPPFERSSRNEVLSVKKSSSKVTLPGTPTW